MKYKDYIIDEARLTISGPETAPFHVIDNFNNIEFVYNGEIYFVREGYQTDFKKILEVLRVNPLSNDLDGMFSYCYYNSYERTAYLNRDSFGIKPLYYLLDDNKLKVCPNMFGLYEKEDIIISPQLLFEYLSIGRSLGEKTIFKNIYNFPTDKILKITRQEDNINCSFFEKNTPVEVTCDNTLEASLRDSVLKCANTEKSLGLFLSGGIDSTAIACILAENEVKNIKTFSLLLGEDGVSSLNELHLPGDSWKTWEHFVVIPKKNEIDRAFNKVLNITSEPCFPMSSVYTFLLSEKAAREKVEVILTGEGADELFLGYESYLVFLGKHDNNFVNFYLGQLSTDIVEDLVYDSILAKEVASRKLLQFTGKETKLINQLLAAENSVSLRPLLDRLSSVSMYHSIEIRCPFLHGDVPNVAKKMLNELNIENLKETKPLLRNELKNLMSERLVRTPKRPLRMNLINYFQWNKLEFLFDKVLTKDIYSKLPLKEKEFEKFMGRLKDQPSEEALIVAMRLYQLCFFIGRTDRVCIKKQEYRKNNNQEL